MPRILVVEDNQRFRQGAESYFQTRRDATAIYSIDYDEAMHELNRGTRSVNFVQGALVDCFFPRTAGSGDISLGKSLVTRMAESDPREQKIVAGFRVLGNYVDVEDTELRKYARFWIGRSEDDISQSAVVRALERVSTVVGKEAATLIAKNTFSLLYREGDARDYYDTLRKAMEESETNQPLGLMVADQAHTIDVPLVLVTSTYHHDMLTQPIQNYASARDWELVDCAQGRPDEKATPEFWKRAFERLERKMQV